MNQLLTLINTLWPISTDLKEALGKLLHRDVLPRKHWLLQPGQRSDRIYFIEKGVVRGYYIKIGWSGRRKRSYLLVYAGK